MYGNNCIHRLDFDDEFVFYKDVDPVADLGKFLTCINKRNWY
jgi:hypothetical protein